MKEKIYPPCSLDTKDGLINFIPLNNGAIERLGYRSFLGLVWCLIKANRANRRNRMVSRFDFTLPVRWF